MKIYRLYAGADGQSHFERLDDDAASKAFETVFPVTRLLFRKAERPDIHTWHQAPRRQWVITLAGSVDIGIGDGSAVTFGAGDVFLAEDVTGQGHTAKPMNWVRAFVHLDG